jgi:hypothetical protein
MTMDNITELQDIKLSTGRIASHKPQVIAGTETGAIEVFIKTYYIISGIKIEKRSGFTNEEWVEYTRLIHGVTA